MQVQTLPRELRPHTPNLSINPSTHILNHTTRHREPMLKPLPPQIYPTDKTLNRRSYPGHILKLHHRQIRTIPRQLSSPAPTTNHHPVIKQHRHSTRTLRPQRPHTNMTCRINATLHRNPQPTLTLIPVQKTHAIEHTRTSNKKVRDQ